MEILLKLISDMFSNGISAILIRLRFSIVFGFGIIILIYAILNIIRIDIPMFIYSITLSAMFFFILTPKNKE